MPHPFPREEIETAAAQLAAAGAAEILAWAEARFGARAAIASSFGPEDLVLIDLARSHAPSLKVFTIDTGRLPPETYEVAEAARNHFAIELETFFPERAAVEKLVGERGCFSFRESIEARMECCGLRKVEPLRRALAGRAAWATGLRREQSITRTGAAPIEWDEAHGLPKLNPLVGWSATEIWEHVRTRGLPYNALHDRGFPSIGCAPCTRAVKPWEDERAGRWWWESTEHRECGLHVRR
jgi:phosphoadenosine phosphosulfate reductase